MAVGRWILDCGHDDYSTELHPITFMALARTEGNRTVVHLMGDPYRSTQLYNPDASLGGLVNDLSRLTLASTKPFPAALVDQVIGVFGGTVTDHLRASELVEATHSAPTPFRICAPPTAAGTLPDLAAQIVTRTGATFSAAPSTSGPCVDISTAVGSTYRAKDIAMHRCNLPWDWLNAQAAAEAGVPGLDLRAKIKGFLPKEKWPIIDADPDSACADPLLAPPIGPSRASADPSGADDTQPFPFLGVISVGAKDPNTTAPTVIVSTTSTTAAPESSTTASSTSAVPESSTTLDGSSTTPSTSSSPGSPGSPTTTPSTGAQVAVRPPASDGTTGGTSLARTGFSTTMPFTLGALLLSVGLGTAVLARRRRAGT